MKYDVFQIAGAILLVLGGQGAVRLLLDHADSGLLGWVPGGFGAQLAGYLVATAAGAVLAGWAHDKAKALGRRNG
ncbi:hypothetical protein ABZ816_31560 [Actinosynnema sp. NPDC047251]|uniref:hypothetical protein n=1 Tax=Saccharothrix espanaensis TaxID=103731 RepID=UPI0002D30FA2|nr:hypothetical protein [Saccharothrix espanaensis]